MERRGEEEEEEEEEKRRKKEEKKSMECYDLVWKNQTTNPFFL